MIYFISDLHFWHTNVINHAGRPFSSAEEMNQTLITNWNYRVRDTDEIFVLGDLTLKGASYANEILPQLHGRKYLIKGNHDRFADQESFDKSLFIWIKDYHELKYQKERFILFHYPIDRWNHFYHGSIHLHGHSHNFSDYNVRNVENGLRRIDVGVDANQMAPVSIEEIRTLFPLSETEESV